MPDGIRPIDGEGLIPLPREVLRAKRRRPERDNREGDEGEFERQFEEGKTLKPLQRRQDDAARVHEESSQGRIQLGDRSAEGLGADLDLLA